MIASRWSRWPGGWSPNTGFIISIPGNWLWEYGDAAVPPAAAPPTGDIARVALFCARCICLDGEYFGTYRSGNSVMVAKYFSRCSASRSHSMARYMGSTFWIRLRRRKLSAVTRRKIFLRFSSWRLTRLTSWTGHHQMRRAVNKPVLMWISRGRGSYQYSWIPWLCQVDPRVADYPAQQRPKHVPDLYFIKQKYDLSNRQTTIIPFLFVFYYL